MDEEAAGVTVRQLAVMIYYTLHEELPPWAEDPPPGMQYLPATWHQREKYENVVVELRKTDPHRETVAPPGAITMDRARELAATYSGGEGNHPLARHRDSMG